MVPFGPLISNGWYGLLLWWRRPSSEVWKFGVTKDTKQPDLSLGTLQLADDVLSVKYSHTKDSQNLVCAAL